MTPITPIPNTIMAMLRHLSGEEFKVVGVLCHRAFSLQEPQTTVEQIQALSGLMAQQVKPTLARLARRGLIFQEGSLYQMVGSAQAVALPPVQYDPALGIRPQRVKPNLLYPEGPWLTESGRLDVDFVRDRADVWCKGNTFRSQAFGQMAIEDVMGSVCKHYLKAENHANLEIDWQSYVAKNQRYLGNVQERLRSGVQIEAQEQADVLRKLPLFQQSLDLVYEAAPSVELPSPQAPPLLNPAVALAQTLPNALRSMPKPPPPPRKLAQFDRLRLWLSDPVLRPEAVREAKRLGYGLVYSELGQAIDLEIDNQETDIAS